MIFINVFWIISKKKDSNKPFKGKFVLIVSDNAENKSIYNINIFISQARGLIVKQQFPILFGEQLFSKAQFL